MKTTRLLALTAVLSCLLIAANAPAEVPQVISYQGFLEDSSGAPLNGAQLMKFVIYDSAAGGTELWSSGFNLTTVIDGLFEVQLGQSPMPPLPNSLFATDTSRYLGITVGVEPEMIPRTRFTTSAYAFESAHAGDADSLGGIAPAGFAAASHSHNVTTGDIVNGTILFEDIGQNSAASGQVIKWNGTAWTAANDSSGGGANWTLQDTVLYTNGFWGIARGNAGNALLGDSGFTAVNLGVECTTGTAATLTPYATVSGGSRNAATAGYSSVGGGARNVASGTFSTVGGGISDTASGSQSTVAGGIRNSATGPRSTVGGGSENVAGSQHSTVAGGTGNIADALGSTVGGGYYNKARGSYSVVSGGGGIDFADSNSAIGQYSAIGGGTRNIAVGFYSSIGGGSTNSARGSYSSIPGGFGNTIQPGGGYSYLFGINSNLTQDSTFMVDMPHIRFGDEVSGYEFPASDGTAGQTLVTNGSGRVNWSTTASPNSWQNIASRVVLVTNTDSVGIGTLTPSAKLDVAGDIVGSGKITIGPSNTNTGTNAIVLGQNNSASGTNAVVGGGRSNNSTSRWSTVSGGFFNTAADTAAHVGGGTENVASAKSATVGGGWLDSASADYSTVAGGYINKATALASFVGGGNANVASGGTSTIGGGISNTASGNQSTVGGGFNNLADAPRSTVGGGSYNNARGIYSVVAGGGGSIPADSNAASGQYSAIGGGMQNRAGGFYSTISGGATNNTVGSYSGVSSGLSNKAGDVFTDTAAYVGGGQENAALAMYSTVGGGFADTASGDYSFVGGGNLNVASGLASSIGGGEGNIATGDKSTIAGGRRNEAQALNAFVGGGEGNIASADNSALGGGTGNVAGGISSTVGGGSANVASGNFAAIPGGTNNTATGKYSFAAGRRAKANHIGSFVWADSTNADFISLFPNEFAIRAAGGIRGVANAGSYAAAFTNNGGGDGLRANANVSRGHNWGALYAINNGTSPAIYASGLGAAGYFNGDVTVTGILSKGGGSFKIDHPLDPQNKYLLHSFVESPDMKNVYDGVVTTDAQGISTVVLPDWFGSLNRDFRYQLTVIGEFAQAIISSEIRNNQFTIRTDKPNVKVSWQVTGIRKDKFAEANRIPTELDKPAGERGKYLHPEAFGLDKSRSVNYHPDKDARNSGQR